MEFGRQHPELMVTRIYHEFQVFSVLCAFSEAVNKQINFKMHKAILI